MLNIEYTTQFKKDLKRVKKRGCDFKSLEKIIKLILEESTLPAKNKNHTLTGNWSHHQECHIKPDWLLIYKVDKTSNAAIFVRTGSHADLF